MSIILLLLAQSVMAKEIIADNPNGINPSQLQAELKAGGVKVSEGGARCDGDDFITHCIYEVDESEIKTGAAIIAAHVQAPLNKEDAVASKSEIAALVEKLRNNDITDDEMKKLVEILLIKVALVEPEAR